MYHDLFKTLLCWLRKGQSVNSMAEMWTINRSVQHIGIQCASFVKSEVLTEANIQIMVYWHVTPFSLVHRDQNFGGNCWPPEGHTHNRILIIEIPLVLICAVLFDII